MEAYIKRYELSASQWRRIEHFLPGRPGSVGVTAKDNRNFVNGVLWTLRSGARWKDLPDRYGKWKSVHKRFTRWSGAGIWERIFKELLQDPKNSHVMIDSTIHCAGPPAGRVWKNKGGPRSIWLRMRWGDPYASFSPAARLETRRGECLS